jgi:hypothetical protein
MERSGVGRGRATTRDASIVQLLTPSSLATLKLFVGAAIVADELDARRDLPVIRRIVKATFVATTNGLSQMFGRALTNYRPTASFSKPNRVALLGGESA